MLNAILFLLGGFVVGKIFSNKHLLFKYLPKTQLIVILLMLFALGLSVGVNQSVMNNISQLGLQALVIALLCIGGSLIMAWLFWEISFRKKQK